MQMHITIAVLFAVTVFVAFLEDRLKEIHKISLLMAYIIFMVFIASTKSIEHTADAENYQDMFYNNNDLIIELMTEPTFIYLSRFVLALGGTVSTMFLIYALISIPAKIKVLSSITPYIFTALIIYIPIYYEVHDLIQIRAAAAATFLLASLAPLARKQYLLAAGFMGCAILFHYSAVCFLPFLLIGNRQLNMTARIIVAVLVPLCFAMYLLKIDLLSFIPNTTSAIGYKMDFYKESAETGAAEEIFPLYLHLYYLSKCLMLLLCLLFYDYIVKMNTLAPILINLFAASTLFLPSMASIPVLAGRISDMYGIIDCIVFTFALYLVSPKYMARTAIAILGLYMLVFNIMYTEYFT